MELKQYDRIIHLSHNDLDGYGCQYLLNLVKEKNQNITFLNTSYFDVNKNVNLVFQEILSNPNDKTLFIISDVNLTMDAGDKINNFKNGNQHLNYDVILIDHHKTGKEVSLKYPEWYKLDLSRCASYLVGQWLINNNKIENDLKNYILFIMEFIDSHDRWLENHKYHDKANLISGFVFNKIEYPDFLENIKRDHIFNLLDIGFNYFMDEKNNIYDFEKNEMKHLLSFLENKIPDEMFFSKDKSYSNKLINLFAEEYKKFDTKTFLINLNENTKYSFKLFYELDSNIFQYLSHFYLNDVKEIDFMVNIKSKGSCSFRSKGDIDVGTLSNKYFNGGGHTNAAGGSIPLEDIKLKSESDVIKILKEKYNVVDFENDIKPLEI